MTIKLTAGRIVRIGTALALGLFVFTPNVVQLSAQAPGQAGPSEPAGPGGPAGRGQGGGGGVPVDLEGKTAAEAFKNIKVLTDIPANELAPTMVFITASLGVRCQHCHVPAHFDQDDKKEKDVARDMMKMMFAINTESFKGERVVTCNTCHNGATPPSGIPLLPGQAPAGIQLLAAPAPPQGDGSVRGPGAESSPSPFAGPPPADILSKYVLALGGDAAIQKVKSRSQTGIVDTAIQPGQPGAPRPVVDAYWTASGKAFQAVHGQRGDNSQGYDGKTGWATGGQGSAAAQPAGAMMAFREWAELFPALHFTTQYSKVEVNGIEKIGGHDAYRVIGKRGGGFDRLYFDTDSGLLLRAWTTFDTALGEIPQQTDFSDYRDVNGVKIPYVVHVVSSEGGDRTYKWNQIQVNGPVDESLSSRPPAKPAGGQPGAPPFGSQRP